MVPIGLWGVGVAWALGPPVSAPPVQLQETALAAVAAASCAEPGRFQWAWVELSTDGQGWVTAQIVAGEGLSARVQRCLTRALRHIRSPYPGLLVEKTWVPIGAPLDHLRDPAALVDAWGAVLREGGDTAALRAALSPDAQVDATSGCVILDGDPAMVLAARAWLETSYPQGGIRLPWGDTVVYPLRDELWLRWEGGLLGGREQLCPESLPPALGSLRTGEQGGFLAARVLLDVDVQGNLRSDPCVDPQDLSHLRTAARFSAENLARVQALAPLQGAGWHLEFGGAVLLSAAEASEPAACALRLRCPAGVSLGASLDVSVFRELSCAAVPVRLQIGEGGKVLVSPEGACASALQTLRVEPDAVGCVLEVHPEAVRH